MKLQNSLVLLVLCCISIASADFELCKKEIKKCGMQREEGNVLAIRINTVNDLTATCKTALSAYNCYLDVIYKLKVCEEFLLEEEVTNFTDTYDRIILHCLNNINDYETHWNCIKNTLSKINDCAIPQQKRCDVGTVTSCVLDIIESGKFTDDCSPGFTEVLNDRIALTIHELSECRGHSPLHINPMATFVRNLIETQRNIGDYNEQKALNPSPLRAGAPEYR